MGFGNSKAKKRFRYGSRLFRELNDLDDLDMEVELNLRKKLIKEL